MTEPQSIGAVLKSNGGISQETLNRIQKFVEPDPVRDREIQERIRQQREHELREKGGELIEKTGRVYALATFASYEIYPGAQGRQQTSVLKTLREFCRSEKPGNLIFYGSVGTGKDHLAIAALKTYIMRGVGVSWVNGTDLYLRLRATFGRESLTSEHSILSEYQSAAILLISDPLPSRGDVSAHKADALYAIVDHRSRRNLPTWTTMNVASLHEANDLIGVPVYDRLAQGALTLKCEWQSYRARKRG